ncbi:ABC-2 family transporter protein [Streptomyces sp. NPDC050704]|uniref:ABC transporter permease n=1 Tax=Streptomyces sp. NPDC050704 TaxID=3157219 RepID=UPI003444CBFD
MTEIPTERNERVYARPGLVRRYFLLLAAAWRSQLQYRANLLFMIVGGIAYQCVGLVFVWAVVERFGEIGGWSLTEISFLYGMRLTAHALWTIPFNQLNRLDEVIREAEFDRYLVRPAGLLVQLTTRQINPQVAGDLLAGVGLLAVSAGLVNRDWTAATVGYLVLAIVGGALVELSLQLAGAALCFKLLSTRSFRLLIDSVFNNFGGYPMNAFPLATQFALTFIVPLAFVAYFPASELLGRADEVLVHPWIATASPLVGLLCLSASYSFWRSQARHYGSAGH